MVTGCAAGHTSVIPLCLHFRVTTRKDHSVRPPRHGFTRLSEPYAMEHMDISPVDITILNGIPFGSSSSTWSRSSHKYKFLSSFLQFPCSLSVPMFQGFPHLLKASTFNLRRALQPIKLPLKLLQRTQRLHKMLKPNSLPPSNSQTLRRPCSILDLTPIHGPPRQRCDLLMADIRGREAQFTDERRPDLFLGRLGELAEVERDVDT
jgi:hypothetical protein